MEVHFVLILLSFLTANGVFGVDPDEVKSVTEGDSVTLHTDTVRQTDDLIVWYYGPENTLVARINGEANSIKLSEDEMFKDRVKLNDQTGDLTITHITSQHSGLYTLRISRNNEISNNTFNLTVNGHFHPLNHITKPTQDPDNTELCLECSESPAQGLYVISAVVFSVFCVIIIIIMIMIIVHIKKRKVLGKSSESKNHLTEEIKSISSSSTCEDEESSKCLSEKQQHWIEAGSV